jgi:tetratricopeptide (TPR) repeat protein
MLVRHNAVTAILMLFLSVMSSSCSGSEAFDKAYAAAKNQPSADAVLAALIRLDQEYPDRFIVKYEIGLLLLGKGDTFSAEPFLKRAADLFGRGSDKDKKASTYGGLALIAYSRGDYKKAEEFGRKAMAVGAPKARGFGFITARSLLGQGKGDEAMKLFDASWADERDGLSRDDYRAYARTLQSAGRNADLVKVLDAYQATFAYEPGSGLMQSSAFESLGDFDSAVFAAFKEVEYGRAFGVVSASDVKKNLAALEKKLDDKSFNPEGKGKAALEIVTAFAREDWATVVSSFAKLRVIDPDPFRVYMRLSALIESKKASPSDVEGYKALLPSFKALPTYYHRVFLGMGGIASGAATDNRLAPLEMAIDLSPKTELAASWRKELAAAAGIPAADAAKLLTRKEISGTAERAAGSGEMSVLAPLVGMLELKDNNYTLMAAGVLRAFAKDARYRSYFVDKARASSGRLKERLEYVLSN